MLIGADYYESEEQRTALFEAGRIPIGIGENSVISNTIVDKNARIGKNCRIINKDGIEEANREVTPAPAHIWTPRGQSQRLGLPTTLACWDSMQEWVSRLHGHEL